MNILSAIYSEKTNRLENHYHNYHQIMYIQDGQVQIVINDKMYTAGKGALVILSRFEKHSVTVLTEEYKRYVIEISPKLFEPVLINRPESFHNITDAGKYTKEIQSIFESIINEYEKKDSFYEKIIDLSLEKLFAYIARLQKFDENTGKSTEIVYSIQKEFEMNYKESYSLGELSAKYHISKYHLSRLFKKITGYAPVEYLLECRMSAAKKYLATTTLSIQEIVEKCGFGDESNFSRMFKLKNALTPTQFRKKYRQN